MKRKPEIIQINGRGALVLNRGDRTRDLLMQQGPQETFEEFRERVAERNRKQEQNATDRGN